jgi:hypothetical protein
MSFAVKGVSHSPPGRELRQVVAGWHSKAVVGAFAAAVCSAYALMVLGPRVLNPLNLSWLAGDPATAYLGWGFFRQESHLTFPLAWSHALGYPFGEPAAYLDSIPLVAVLSWFVSFFVARQFQYFGLYFLVCCILQLYFGYRISLRVCDGNRMAGLLGAGFFLTAPIFTWRSYGHFALASHWLILAAFDQFVGAVSPVSRRQVAWRAAICFLAASINPYIAVMTLLVICATYVRPFFCTRKWPATCLPGIAASGLSTVLGFALFGFLPSSDIGQYVASGYEYYSMNLLAPIDPGAPGALLLKQQPVGPGQYEGNAYLGLGLLLLGIVSFARRPAIVRKVLAFPSVPAMIVFGISLIAALSTRATIGNHVLYEVGLVSRLLPALEAFHASGRLFWPGYYLIFIAIIAAAYRAFHSGWVAAVLAAALVIQVADLAPLRAAIHSKWQSSLAAATPAGSEWHVLGEKQRNLVVLPAWQCSNGNPEELTDWDIFGKLALQQHMTINSFYAARYSPRQLRFFCSGQMAEIEQAGLRSDTAYVLHRHVAGLLAGLDLGGNYCRYSDKYVLCSRVDGRSGLEPALLRSMQALLSGDVVNFAGHDDPRANELAVSGWSVAEPWGRWTEGERAALVFRLAAVPHSDVHVDLSVVPFLLPSHPRQHVEVFANGELIAQPTFQQGIAPEIQLVIPQRAIASDGIVRLVFKLPDAISPAAAGMPGADPRKLSIGLVRLRLSDAD